MRSLRGQASSSEAVRRNKRPRGVVSVPRISWGGREGGRRERDGGREGWRERLRRNGEKERKERRVRWNEGEHQIEGLLAEEAERG